MNSIVVLRKGRKQKENFEECPILKEQNYDHRECDLPQFKKLLWGRGISCRDRNGDCRGIPVRKIMYRIDNPERRVSSQELERIVAEIEEEIFREEYLMVSTSR